MALSPPPRPPIMPSNICMRLYSQGAFRDLFDGGGGGKSLRLGGHDAPRSILRDVQASEFPHEREEILTISFSTSPMFQRRSQVHAELKNDRSYQQLQKIVRMRLMEAGAILGSVPSNSRNIVQASGAGFQMGPGMLDDSEVPLDTAGMNAGGGGLSWQQPVHFADPSFYFNPLSHPLSNMDHLRVGDQGTRRRALSDNGVAGLEGGGGAVYRPFLLSTAQGLAAADQHVGGEEGSMRPSHGPPPLPPLEDQSSLAATIAAEQL